MGSCTWRPCSSGARSPSRGDPSCRCSCSAAATVWAIGGLLLPTHPDTLGALLFLSFAAFILRGRTPGVYAAAFVLTAALELYGTRLGTWAWAPHDPTGLLSAANPPSGIPGGYCWLDFWALALAPLAYGLLVRARARLSVRPARAAPS